MFYFYCPNCGKEEIVEKIIRYKDYFGKEGGVTVSGGEALLQWEFVAKLLEE